MFINQLFKQRGDDLYIGESISQKDHALQCAWILKKKFPKDEVLIAAGLLHDIGQLIGEADDPTWGNNGHHIDGMIWLMQRGCHPDVCKLVFLHVNAKRYLCSVDSKYYSKLSKASKATLKAQGGMMTAAEIKEFKTHPLFHQALTLRLADDEAKKVNLIVPDIQEYIPVLTRMFKSKL